MPIIACPKCQGKLRFPDDSPPRRVKCPTCGHVFQGSSGAASSPTSPAGEREPRSDFEHDDDRDDRRRRRDRDDDDDRGRRRRDDEDESDRPRSRRRNDRNDDDRSDRRRRDEDDDYDRDDRRRRGPDRQAIEGQFNRASLACLLCFIGGWLRVGALGVFIFALLLMWAELREGFNTFLIIAGLLGIGQLLTSAVGYGFLISGPRNRGALGLSIATGAVAAFHLILTIVLANSGVTWFWGFRYAGVNWDCFLGEGTALSQLLFLAIGLSEQELRFGPAILQVFASFADVALVILFLLSLRSVARCAKDNRRARMAMQAIIANAVGAGIFLIAGILFGLLFRALRTEKGTAAVSVIFLFGIVLLLTQIALTVWTTLIIKSVKDSIDYRRD